jgi:hypothetical protein
VWGRELLVGAVRIKCININGWRFVQSDMIGWRRMCVRCGLLGGLTLKLLS